MAWGLAALWSVLYGWRVVDWSRGLTCPKTPLANDRSPLTVLIPCRNEAARLPDLLDDLRGLHVLVIDDASEDGTAEIARQLGASVLPNRGEGKKDALRTGFEAASTEWVATLDADVRVGPQWAEALLGAAGPGIDAVVGPVRLEADPRAPWQRVQAMEFGCMMGWAHATARNGKAENGSGANLLWRRRVWLELDLCSDEASGDDVFALASLVARGGQTASAWCPEAIATTVPASSWRDWVQQRARWGRKARKYRSGGAQHVSALVLTYLLLLPALAGSAPASAVALFATKFLLDAQYTNRIARAYSLPWNPVSDAVRLAFAYPVLVAAAGLRMAAPLAWKGRRI